MVNTILFDADGVIQTTPPEFMSRLRSLVPDSEADAFLQEVFTAERPSLLGQEDFATALLAVLVGRRADIRLRDALRLWHLLEPQADILDLVQRLRRSGLTCALATNQQAYRASHMRDRMGLDQMFDRLFFSCELHAMKPASEFFEAVLSSLSAAPDTVLFIDDNSANVAAASAMGMQVLQFDVHDFPENAAEHLLKRLRESGVQLG